MAETANPYIQGFDDPSVSGGIDVAENPTEMQTTAAEQEQDTTSRDLDIEKIRENAQMQRNLHRLQQILDEIRTQRAREIAQKDIEATGQKQNGLFGWRALRRSYEGFIKNIVNASGDMSKAQERLDSELIAQDNPENLSTIDRALEAFRQTCDQSQKQELTELMGMISDRYALEKQNGNATSEVVQKIEQTIMANSALLNMAIGAVFRTAFRSISHVGGLGGALLTSAIYGGASAGLRERRKARQEELSASAWKQELEKLETPEQKLGLLRQIAENPGKFRTYFEGRSAEALEFFLLYQQTLSETDLQKVLEGAPPNIREIYAGKKIGARALVAAGRGALRSMTFSGIGYAITHGLSSLAHGELAMAQGEGSGDTQWKDQAPQYPITWREHLDQDMQTPRLELSDRGRFETGDNQYAEVKIEDREGEGGASSPENVAGEIAKSLGKAGRPDKMRANFQITDEQQTQIKDHITQYLRNKNIDYSEGATIRVPASELNDALDKAGVKINSDSLTYEVPEAPEAEAPAPAQEPEQSPEGEEALADEKQEEKGEGAGNEDGGDFAPPSQPEASPTGGGGANINDDNAGLGGGASDPIAGQGEDGSNGEAPGMKSKEVAQPDQADGGQANESEAENQPETPTERAETPEPDKAETDEEKNWIERIGGAKIIGLAILIAGVVEWKRRWKDVQTIKRGLGGVAGSARERIAKARSGRNGSEESQETERNQGINFLPPAGTDTDIQSPTKREAPKENDEQPAENTEAEAQPVDIEGSLKKLENVPSNIFSEANLAELNSIAHEIYDRNTPNDPEKTKLINIVYTKIFTGLRVTSSIAKTDTQSTSIESTYQPRPFIIERPDGDKTYYKPISSQNIENQRFTTRTIGSGESIQARDGEDIDAETLKNRLTLWNTWYDIRLATPQEIINYQ